MRMRRAGLLLVLAAGLLWAGGVGWGMLRGAGWEIVLGPHDGHDLPAVDLERVSVGDTAPDFTLESFQSGVITLSDFRSQKNVLLVFYRGHW